jgi:hypothetical protein
MLCVQVIGVANSTHRVIGANLRGKTEEFVT